jgi:3',5'-cyclic AMP phosphodiesterase CpdA
VDKSNNKENLRFLHITDCHLTGDEILTRTDIKQRIAGIDNPLRAEVLRDTLKSLAEYLTSNKQNLDGVIFSGDATFKGDQKGQIILRDMLLEQLACVIGNQKILSVPGNHDIITRTPPDTEARYRNFCEAWGNSDNFVIPALEGVHSHSSIIPSNHILEADRK